MKPPDWQRVERALFHPYGRVELRCDGRSIVAYVVAVKPLRFAITVYVDGQWRGEWGRAEKPCDEQRFMNPRSQALHKASELALYGKLLGAKKLRELKEKRFTWYSPHFPNATALRRRLVGQCKQIELVSTSLDGLEQPAPEEAHA